MSLRALWAVAALAVAAPAFAQTDPAPAQGAAESPAPSASPMAAAREQLRKACAVDIKTYCTDLPEGGRVGRCLQQNADRLSPDCKTQMEEMRARWREHRRQQP
jgi:hypothetical protein